MGVELRVGWVGGVPLYDAGWGRSEGGRMVLGPGCEVPAAGCQGKYCTKHTMLYYVVVCFP